MNSTNKSIAMQALLMFRPPYRKNAERSGPFEKILSLGPSVNATAADSPGGCRPCGHVLTSAQWKLSRLNTQTCAAPVIKLVKTGRVLAERGRGEK